MGSRGGREELLNRAYCIVDACGFRVCVGLGGG
jgi:hypothetical protein